MSLDCQNVISKIFKQYIYLPIDYYVFHHFKMKKILYLKTLFLDTIMFTVSDEEKSNCQLNTKIRYKYQAENYFTFFYEYKVFCLLL